MREAGERVRVALKNTGIPLPAARITVNLAPADIPKRGTVIDLPVAVGELICMEMLRQEDFEDVLVAGELGLNGEIRPVRGVLPIVQTAKAQGIRLCILPAENLEEGAVVEGMACALIWICGRRTWRNTAPWERGKRDALRISLSRRQ